MANNCPDCGTALWADESCYTCHPEEVLRDELDEMRETMAEIEAERDRYKAALDDIASMPCCWPNGKMGSEGECKSCQAAGALGWPDRRTK